MEDIKVGSKWVFYKNSVDEYTCTITKLYLDKRSGLQYVSLGGFMDGPNLNVSLFEFNRWIDQRHISLVEIDIPHCIHDFKKYVGFTDTYDYCVKCNERQK